MSEAEATQPEAQAPAEVTVKSLSGFDEGTVLTGADGSREVVRGTYDENNKLVGWHKEAVTGGEV